MLAAVSIILGSVFIILGFIGCILPVLPGPPLSFAGLFILALVKGFSPPLTVMTILILGIVALIAYGLDYIIPSIGAKKYGASKWGIIGSIAGMLIGILFFPPFGIFIGGFMGAFLFEWIVEGKDSKAALRAGQGVLIGSLLGIVIKLMASGVITYYFIYGLF